METILTIIGILIVINICREIYSKFDHTKYDRTVPLDVNAQIISLKSERVAYSRHNPKIKTIVTFSDGFTFVTHRTKSEMTGILHYTIFIDEGEIIDRAMKAHAKAVHNS